MEIEEYKELEHAAYIKGDVEIAHLYGEIIDLMSKLWDVEKLEDRIHDLEHEVWGLERTIDELQKGNLDLRDTITRARQILEA